MSVFTQSQVNSSARGGPGATLCFRKGTAEEVGWCPWVKEDMAGLRLLGSWYVWMLELTRFAKYLKFLAYVS